MIRPYQTINVSKSCLSFYLIFFQRVFLFQGFFQIRATSFQIHINLQHSIVNWLYWIMVLLTNIIGGATFGFTARILAVALQGRPLFQSKKDKLCAF